MSTFTHPLFIMAVPTTETGLKRFLPPGFQRPKWEVIGGFSYVDVRPDESDREINVPDGFPFDGASVPLPFRLLVPMAHPNYIQATALHDWMLESGQYTRLYCDQVFYRALGVLGLANPWRKAMYVAVRIGALRWHLRRIVKGTFRAR